MRGSAGSPAYSADGSTYGFEGSTGGKALNLTTLGSMTFLTFGAGASTVTEFSIGSTYLIGIAVGAWESSRTLMTTGMSA
jgi:hypothetical protein